MLRFIPELITASSAEVGTPPVQVAMAQVPPPAAVAVQVAQ